jgi:hypothetical protein
MVIVQILKRKDASSVVVAIVLGLILLTLLSSVTGELSAKISGTADLGGYAGSPSWKLTYLQPVVAAALQVIALEVLGWVYVFVKGLSKGK